MFAPMSRFKDQYRTESTRMPYWDYASTALYFITICTEDKKLTLGAITDGELFRSDAGNIADECWLEIPAHFPFVTLDKFQVMPNHVHGIIHISGSPEKVIKSGRDTIYGVSTRERLAGRSFGKLQRGSLSHVIQNYKAAVKRKCTQLNIPFAWQHNFHDHIIRDDKAYHKIRWYIENNVANWQGDSLNPEPTTTIEFPEHLR